MPYHNLKQILTTRAFKLQHTPNFLISQSYPGTLFELDITAMASDPLHDNLLANHIGASAYYYMVNCVSTSLCYGAVLSLFYGALRVSTVKTTKARTLLLGLTTFMFLMSTGLFVIILNEDFTYFRWARDTITESSLPFADRVAQADSSNIPNMVSSTLFEIINFMISDAIVLWRAAVLWPNSRILRGGLCLLLLGEVAISVYDLINSNIAIVGSNGLDVSSWVRVDFARILVSLGVNFLGTVCIAVKAWHFRRSFRLGFAGTTTRRSFVGEILTLMIECGLIFCAVQLLYAIFALVVVPRVGQQPLISPLRLFVSAMAPFFSLFAGMYPSLVILVMSRQRSLFGTSTFVAFSRNADPADKADMHQQRAQVSTLHFATVPEIVGQRTSHTQSVSENTKDLDASESNDVVHVGFVQDVEKVV